MNSLSLKHKPQDHYNANGTLVRYVPRAPKGKRQQKPQGPAKATRPVCRTCGGAFQWKPTSAFGRVMVNQDGSEHAPTCPQDHGHVGRWVGVPAVAPSPGHTSPETAPQEGGRP